LNLEGRLELLEARVIEVVEQTDGHFGFLIDGVEVEAAALVIEVQGIQGSDVGGREQ